MKITAKVSQLKPFQCYLSTFRRRKLPYVSTSLAMPSVQQAVDNILYNTPSNAIQPQYRNVLNCLVSNEPGVLSRISGILAGRGFNIDSLVVAKTEIKDLSRMTIVVNASDALVEQAIKQLEDVVPVWAVLNYSGTAFVERERIEKII
jgi:acetolactate synthase-1/3 small subunit